MEGHEILEVGEEEEQRRVLASQLQEKLHQDQQQLASNEQQNQLLKSKLSLIKSRSKAKRESAEKDGRHINVAKDVTDASPKRAGSNINDRNQARSKSNKGKINVLREQLEQNRLRFERHGQQLTEDARSMEAVVEQLRHKLEDSDVTLQQLQAGQLQPVMSSSDEQGTEPEDVGSQLAGNKVHIQKLMSQNADLQNTILELQENLKEKDCVIDARTRAITLLSEDMSKKWKANVDMLEETRQQMHIMQENFVTIEAGLNKEIKQLNHELESKSKKLMQVEHTLKQTESARFELVTRNAELQEKVVNLQAQVQDGSGLKEAEIKIEELNQALSDANRLAVKLKTEHKAKVKTLKIQIDGLRKDSTATEEIARLQNHIAVLEGEKATQAEQLEHLQKTVMELQNLKVASEIRVVETEDQINIIDLEQAMSDLKMKLEDRDREIVTLKEKISNTELENEVDQTLSVSVLKRELMEARSALKEWQYRYESLEAEFLDHQKSLKNYDVSCPPDTHCNADRDVPGEEYSPPSKASLLELNEKEIELAQTKKALSTLKATLLSRVESLENSFHEKCLQIQELESVINVNVEKIQSDYFVEIFASQNNCEEIRELRSIIIECENQIKHLEGVVKNMEIHLEEYEALKANFIQVSHELAQIRDNVSSSAILPESSSGCELCKDFSNLQIKILELSGELEIKQEENSRLKTKLKAQGEKLKKLAVNLKVENVTNKELEHRVCIFEKIIETNNAQLEELSKEKLDLLVKYQNEITEKNDFICQSNASLAKKDQVIENLVADLERKASALSALQVDCNSLQIALQEKHNSYEEVSENCRNQQVAAMQMTSLEEELSSLRELLSKETEEKLAAVAKLESFTKTVKLKLAKEKKLRNEMNEKHLELEGLVAEKTKIIDEIHRKYQQDIVNLNQEILLLQTQIQERLSVLTHDITESDKSSMHCSQSFIVNEDLSPPPSLETFEVEIENLCCSLSENSDLEILPILEEEKKKTLGELQSRFDVIHGQMVSRLNHSSDLQGERKLFTELQNLVIRVTNRTTVLEKKTQKIMIDFEEHMKSKMLDAQERIQTLEGIILELRGRLNEIEVERNHNEEELNQVCQEKHNLEKLLQDENIKSSKSEKELARLHQEMRDIVSSVQNLESNLQGKDVLIDSLRGECEQKESDYRMLQDQIQERDLIIPNLQSQVQNGETRIAMLQAESGEKEYQNQILQNEILERDSLVCALQAQIKEHAAVIDTMQTQTQEIPRLNDQILELNRQNLTLEENLKDLRNIEQLLSEVQVESKEAQAQLQQTQQQLQESIFESADVARQLKQATERTEALEIQLMEASQKVKDLEQQLSHTLQLCSDHCSVWRTEKDDYEKRLNDLTEQLQHSQLVRTSQDSNMENHKSSRDECLQKQLAEKTAEVETYQQRLIQLQMGMADPVSMSFSAFSDSASSNELIQLRSKVKELQDALEQQSLNSNKLLDSFNSTSSLFEISEVSQLKNQLADASRELELVLSEKQHWEKQQKMMSESLHRLEEQLHASTVERDIAQTEIQSLSELKSEVELMTAELNTAKNAVNQIDDLQNKIDDQNEKIQELQSRLDYVQTEKEKVEKDCKLLRQQLSKLQEQAKVAQSTEDEDRPSIPQTLDTLVLTLQTSDSDSQPGERPSIPRTLDTHVSALLTSDGDSQSGEFIHGAMDESLMEHNIIQLESELSGMVTSHLEARSKQKDKETEDWNWKEEKDSDETDTTETLTVTQVAKEKALASDDEESLRTKIVELESEKNCALAEVAKLQDEIKYLSQGSSVPGTDTSISVDQNWPEEDSWGWGTDNGKIEEQFQKHHGKADTHSLVNELQSKISSLETEKEFLESDKLKMAEDLKVSQLRAAKLTRKYKELNAKYNEIAERKKSTESQIDTLDQAIEEERSKQIQGLEKAMKDMQTELGSLRVERDKFQKQVEVFSSANERMVEAKERQDVEVEMWQRRSNDLSHQVHALEWRIQELEVGKAEHESNAVPEHSFSEDALNSTTVDQLLKENRSWNASYESLMQEYQKLQAQSLLDNKHKAEVDALVAEQKDLIHFLEQENSCLRNMHDSLKADLEKMNATCLQDDLKLSVAVDEKNTDLLQKLNESEKKLDETLIRLQELSTENIQLQAQCAVAIDSKKELLLDLDCCKKELSENLKEVDHLREEVRLLQSGSDNFNNQLAQNVSQNPVLNWNTMVREQAIGQDSIDVFDTIATTSLESPAQDDHLRSEWETQIANMKMAHEESEKQLNGAIEYLKNQLESARITIDELQMKLNSGHTELNIAGDHQIQQLQTDIFNKEKEIENLQISLTISEEARKKLENYTAQRSMSVEEVVSPSVFMSPEEIPSSNVVPPQLVASISPNSFPLKPVNPNHAVSELTHHSENSLEELDLALYRLHQRDVRCDELTLELTRLLEERDALQLRLSNALRTNEGLRDRLNQLLPASQDGFPYHNVVSNVPPSVMEQSALSPSLLPDRQIVPEQHESGLERKLAEIHETRYGRDKWLREDQELRHQQQMQFLYSTSGTGRLGGLNVEQGLNITVAPPQDDLHSSDANESSSPEAQGSLLDWLWGRR